MHPFWNYCVKVFYKSFQQYLYIFKVTFGSLVCSQMAGAQRFDLRGLSHDCRQLYPDSLLWLGFRSSQFRDRKYGARLGLDSGGHKYTHLLQLGWVGWAEISTIAILQCYFIVRWHGWQAGSKNWNEWTSGRAIRSWIGLLFSCPDTHLPILLIRHTRLATDSYVLCDLERISQLLFNARGKVQYGCYVLALGLRLYHVGM